MPITDPLTGLVTLAGNFIAVLGASRLTYAEATWTKTLPDWIGAHVRMLRFWDIAPRLLMPDNLKSAIHKASFYDPKVNRSYGGMASHYGVGILPASPRRPRDKAAVEAGVRFAQPYILGPLRSTGFIRNEKLPRPLVQASHQCFKPRSDRQGVNRTAGKYAPSADS